MGDSNANCVIEKVKQLSLNSRCVTTILPLNLERTRIDCLLTIDARDYVLHLVVPNYPSFHDCSLNVNWDLNSILRDPSTKFDIKKIQHCKNVEEVVDEIIPFIEEYHQTKCITSIPESGDDTVGSDYSEILEEIELIGWDKLVSVNRDFTELKLRMNDIMEREHILTIKLNNSSSPEFIAEYPRNIQFEWRQGSTLKEVYNIFCQEAEQYQEFWQVMDELDRSCRVLEPENPSMKDTYRKIALTQNVSLKIDVDLRHPRLFPGITWLGSETAVFNFREKVLDRVEMWEPDEPIHSNLERILEIELPCRAEEGLGNGANNQEGEFEVMCCICYSTRLEGQVPSRTCDNPQCGQSFHAYCLYEWLRSLIQTTRRHGNKIFGACPYCEQPISCKPPEPH